MKIRAKFRLTSAGWLADAAAFYLKRTMTSPQCFAHERRVFDVVTLDGDLLAFLDECGWNVVFAGSRDGFLLFGALDDVVIPDEKSEGGRSWTNKLKKLCLLVCVFVNLFVRVFVCLLICLFVYLCVC